MAQLAQEQQDHSFSMEVAQAARDLKHKTEQTQMSLALQGPQDRHTSIITLNSGAGGTESQDWAETLLGMYITWAKSKNRPTKLMNTAYGDRAGIRTATIEVGGKQAYGILKTEAGVHRLIRMSPFDPEGRRQTSFARVEVLPAVPEQSPIEPDPKDLRTDIFHASGPGGQHIHKVATAIRITHIPTGITVTCQTERSQRQNRDYAMRILRARLQERRQREEQETRQKERDKVPSPHWGQQARSYFLHPHQHVVDHRSGHSTPNAEAVLAGNIDQFIKAALLQGQAGAKD